MVFQRSMLDWRRGWWSICHGYMCIVLYMKLIWCDGFPEIYAQLEEGVVVNLPWVYVHCAIYETYLVWWFSRDLCSIGGGVGSICHGYMCTVLYMKLIWCDGFPEICARLEEWVGSICHGYMCIVLYMNFIWCNEFPEIYAQLEEGVGGQSAMGICALCYIWNVFGVMVFQRSMLDWRRGRGVNLPWVYVHCAIYETYLVWWFSRDLCLIGGGGRGSICHGYMCIVLYMKLIWCDGFPEIYAQLEEG